jgi:YesN/AraC family two-component response regulator
MNEKLRTEFHSRQSMVEPNFEAYYYTDLHLHRVNMHKHDNYEIMLFLEGDVSNMIGGTSYKLKPNDLFIIPPGIFHQVKIDANKGAYRRFILWISASFFEQMEHWDPCFAYLNKPVVNDKRYLFHLDAIASYNLQSKIIRLLESMQEAGFGKKAHEQLCCSDILLTINQMLYERDHPYEAKETDSLAESIFTYIKLHIDEDISLESLANTFYISKYYISHLFKSHVGMSVHQYIIKKRLDMVRTAILTDGEISKACEQAGFKNYSNFYRSFVKEYGMSPKEYKEEHRLENVVQNE